jgi:hypothetical protein
MRRSLSPLVADREQRRARPDADLGAAALRRLAGTDAGRLFAVGACRTGTGEEWQIWMLA